METTLDAKNKFGFVDRTIIKSPTTNPTTFKKVAFWKRCNNLVVGWQYDTKIGTHLCNYLLESSDQININIVFYIIKTKLTKCVQRKESITTYFTRLQNIWDELANYEE